MTPSRLYESVFIVNATLEDNHIDAVVEKARDLIVKQGGEIRTIEKWGRKRLSYPIQKKNNGFYVAIEFAAPNDLLAKLERHYSLEENVIRHLTILLDKKALLAREQALKAAATEVPAGEEPKAVPEKPEVPQADEKSPRP